MGNELGPKLRKLRMAKGLSLRQVATDAKISNGYLHLLETGHVESPRPDTLHKLADAYEVEYESIMEWAGYLQKSSATKESYGVALSSTLNRTINKLSPEELSKVADYIKYIKSQKST